MKSMIYKGKSAEGRIVPFGNSVFKCPKGTAIELPDDLADQLLLNAQDWEESKPAKAPKEKV